MDNIYEQAHAEYTSMIENDMREARESEKYEGTKGEVDAYDEKHECQVIDARMGL